jgi:hypothetical protein
MWTVSRIYDHNRTVFAQYPVENGIASGQFAHRKARIRFDPNAALVGKSEQRGFRLKVFDGEPGDGVVAGFGFTVENSGPLKGSQALRFAAKIDRIR